MRLLVIGSALHAHLVSAPAFEAAGFGVDSVETLEDAEALLQDAIHGAVLLASTSDASAVLWLAQQRRRGLSVPVLFCTARGGAEERIAAFEAGADDCVPVAVTGRELLARLRAALRRPPLVMPADLRVGNVRLDVASREVWVAERQVRVPRREVGLLEQLMQRAGRVVPRSRLEAQLYGLGDDVAPNAIEVGVSRIRRRMAEAQASPTIQTVRGVGYVMNSPARKAAGGTVTA